MSAAILLPLAFTGVASAVALRMYDRTVTDLLSPDVVAPAETVQEQYLSAVLRNDEAGWRAVGENFPASENATNAGYYAKSTLQLANLMAGEERLRDADRLLDTLARDSSVDRVYQAIALARRCVLLEQLGQLEELNDTRRDLQSLYGELKANSPGARRLIDRVLSDDERLMLGVSDS
jgi:serine/threonine-protein kinase